MAFQTTPPQHFLDDLHKVKLPALFDTSLTARQRADAIRAAKQNLAKVKLRLQDQRDSIRSQMMRGRKKDDDDSDIKLKLAPYNLLQNLILEMEAAIQNLEDRLGAGKLIPKPMVIGEFIFGEPTTGEWFIGNLDDSKRWDDTVLVKRRRAEFMEQYKPMKDQFTATKMRVAQMRESLKKETEKYNKQSQRGYIMRRILIFFILGAAALGIGAYAFLVLENPLGAIGIGLGAILLLMMPLLYLRWRRSIKQSRQDLLIEQQAYKAAKRDGQQFQIQFMSLDETMRELQKEYSQLRATFGK